jgi:hypothetical protein
MWGFDCFFSSFSSNSRGVSILFNNNFEYEILKEKRDLNGNYLALDVVIVGIIDLLFQEIYL